MFGFGKKKIGSILVIRSDRPVTVEQKANITEHFRKEFPEHKVVFLSDGLRIEFVKAEAP